MSLAQALGKLAAAKSVNSINNNTQKRNTPNNKNVKKSPKKSTKKQITPTKTNNNNNTRNTNNKQQNKATKTHTSGKSNGKVLKKTAKESSEKGGLDESILDGILQREITLEQFSHMYSEQLCKPLISEKECELQRLVIKLLLFSKSGQYSEYIATIGNNINSQYNDPIHNIISLKLKKFLQRMESCQFISLFHNDSDANEPMIKLNSQVIVKLLENHQKLCKDAQNDDDDDEEEDKKEMCKDDQNEPEIIHNTQKRGKTTTHTKGGGGGNQSKRKLDENSKISKSDVGEFVERPKKRQKLLSKTRVVSDDKNNRNDSVSVSNEGNASHVSVPNVMNGSDGNGDFVTQLMQGLSQLTNKEVHFHFHTK